MSTIRGTKHYTNQEAQNYQTLERIFFKITSNFGAHFIKPSSLSDSSLFMRTSGITSDICNKEMFIVSSLNASNTSKSCTVLNPEGTAPVISALENCVFNQYLRVSYFEKIYRYNRPQKHRLREFTQAGVEFFGAGPLLDFEAIYCAYQFLTSLGIEFVLRLNNIGNSTLRNQFSQELIQLFQQYKEQLNSITYQKALENPLRALDKLTQEEKNIIKVPFMPITSQMQQNFDYLLNLLDKHNIPFILDPFIVRGLDYYSETVFEFTNQHTTLLAGGRYDNLVSKITKQNCEGIGWALGVDRALEYMNLQTTNETIYIFSINEDEFCLKIAEKLRKKGFNVLLTNVGIKNGIKKGLEQANKNNIKWVILIGEEEMKEQILLLKDMIKGTEKKLNAEEIVNHLFALHDPLIHT